MVFKNLCRSLIFLGFLLAFSSPLTAAQKKESNTKPLLIAHYMTWFGLPEISGNWYQWKFAMDGVGLDKHHYPDLVLADGRRDIAAVHYPVIGPYDSTDPIALEYHILLAKEAGIDGFMVNWYGFQDKGGTRRQEDKGFEALLRAAEKLNFKVCVNFDDKSAFPPYWDFTKRQEAVKYMKQTLKTLFEKYGTSPGYLKIDNRPVFSNFGWTYVTSYSIEQKSFSAREWKSILDDLSGFKPYFIHDHQWDWRKSIEEAGFLDVSESIYYWIGRKEDRLAFLIESGELLKKGKLNMITGSANPGFDNTPCWGWGGGVSQVLRRDGQEYRDQLAECVESNSGLFHLITWNDFTEGSTIEPTREYGNKYLEITAETANLWSKEAPYGKLLDLPKKIYDLREKQKVLSDHHLSSTGTLTRIDDSVNKGIDSFLRHDRANAEKFLKEAAAILEAEQKKVPWSPKLEVSLSPPSMNIFVGETARLSLRIKNPFKDTVPVYIELNRTEIPRSWLGELERTLWLKSGEEKTVSFPIRIPADAKETIGWFTATVDSPYKEVTSNVTHIRVHKPYLMANVGPVNLLRLDKEENLVLTLDSKNKDNQPAKLSFAAPAGWAVRASSGADFILPKEGTASLPFTVKIPAGADDRGTLTATVSYGADKELVIREPLAAIQPGKASILEGDIDQDGTGDYVLGNETIEIHCTSILGGRILSTIYRPTGHNQLLLNYPSVARTDGNTWDKWAEYGGINDWFPGDWPGQVWNNTWEVRSGSHDGDEVFLMMSSKLPEQLSIQRGIFVGARASSAKLLYEIQNLSDSEKNIFWTNHPDVAPGGSAGAEDLIVVPLPRKDPDKPELARKNYSPRLQKTQYVPGENWVLGYDTKSKEYFGEVFNSSLVEKIGVWEGKNFFTMELIFNKMLMAPGEIKKFSLDYFVGQDELDAAIKKLSGSSN